MHLQIFSYHWAQIRNMDSYWKLYSTICRYVLVIIHAPSSTAIEATSKFPFSMTTEPPWNHTEFHGTACISEIGPLKVSWNRIERFGHYICSKFHTDPCNFKFPIFDDVTCEA